MSQFLADTYFPRASSSVSWRSLLDQWEKPVDQIVDSSIDLRQAHFHPASEVRIGEAELISWRNELNDWAFDLGFPSAMSAEQRSAWDVALGVRLADDCAGLAEQWHPDVWCWLATHLLPHFVVYRWGWPTSQDGGPPTVRSKWARFGTDLRNGLRLAAYRVHTYGPELAGLATEQEFQSVQYRPAYGLDQRVAKVVVETLVTSYSDKKSIYGKDGGSRSLDCDDVCTDLRISNSLRPLCFMSDKEIAGMIDEAFERLPEYREKRQQKNIEKEGSEKAAG